MNRFILACGLLLWMCEAPALAAQPTRTDTLFHRGAAAYNALPSVVTRRDAVLFSQAYAWMYAYQQRQTRDGKKVDDDAYVVLDWLKRSLGGVSSGKADGIWSGAPLLIVGKAQRDQLIKSKTDAGYWDVAAYIRATANLVAYRENVIASGEVITLLNQVTEAGRQLVMSGGKADDGRSSPAEFFPPTKRPKLRSKISARMLTSISPAKH